MKKKTSNYQPCLQRLQSVLHHPPFIDVFLGFLPVPRHAMHFQSLWRCGQSIIFSITFEPTKATVSYPINKSTNLIKEL